ncbi:MAG: MATE family efflux transporter, partial [Clostridia bacterium]|nr:MATE family efflux transporter [Clostridia bacterium]
CVRVEIRRLRIHWDMLKKIVAVGIPAAIQMAITSFSNVFVQSYIANVNGVQANCLGGWTTYSKVDQFIFLPVQSIALAVTTFVGQNLGTNDVKRAKKGTRTAFMMALAVTVVLIVLVMLLAPYLAAIFTADPEIVRYATLLLQTITPFYVFPCINQIFSAALRGAGETRAPMFIMLGSFVAFRQVYLYVVSTFISNEILPIGMSYPAGWFLCAVCTLLYYRHCDFSAKRVVET